MLIKTITCHEVYNHGASLQEYALLRFLNDSITYKPDGLSQHFKLWGMKNPYPFLKDCDLYVQTSLHEGYCITLREAKVFDKPVVTTNFLSASNLITHEQDGLIVDISADGLFNGVKQILENKDLSIRLSQSLHIPGNENVLDKILS
jgi:glycosyltransferase involved in cell wall biosynthesis